MGVECGGDDGYADVGAAFVVDLFVGGSCSNCNVLWN